MGDIMSRRGRLEPSDNWLGLVGFLLLVLATLDVPIHQFKIQRQTTYVA